MSWAAVVAFVAAGLLADSPSQPAIIGLIPVDRSPDVKRDRVALDLAQYDGTDYGEVSRRKALVKRDKDTLEVDLQKINRASTDKASARYRRCTFAIDCDEKSILAARDQLVHGYGPKPTAKDIERFVSEYITKKSYAFALAPASITAASREGDCTEHAMLFTALARLSGYAARFIDGFVLVDAPAGDRKTVAIGHAWAEVHDGKRWQRFDPALTFVQATDGKRHPQPEQPCVVYVPVHLLDDEGPGFAHVGGFDMLFVKRVVVSNEFSAAKYCR